MEQATEVICAICGKGAGFNWDEEVPEAIQDSWQPSVYQGDRVLSPVCPDHPVRLADDGELELVEE